MNHQLETIKQEHILRAVNTINIKSIPKDHKWNEYWINYDDKLYPFKYTVSVASQFTDNPIQTTDFTSNDSSRNYIAKLGFHILHKSMQETGSSVNYWVAASSYGLPSNQIDMIADFKKEKYWGTDHDLTVGEGNRIYQDLKTIKINDRICIRYFDKKGGIVTIDTLGTINDISEIESGRLGVIWDYNPPLYKGKKPAGKGAGNWWRTLFKISRPEDVELIYNNIQLEKRVARIAWNDNGWVMPSGIYGKSKSKGSHEFSYGYGHEEWLFDFSKTINGFHYGFLEPIRKQHSAYLGKNFDVWLFSIHSETKKRYWVGEISKLEVISTEEAEKAKQIYQQNGWSDEMKNQIIASGANEEGFSNWSEINLFNIKFKPNDAHINDPYFELPLEHVAYKQSRYTFINHKPIFDINKIENKKESFTFQPAEKNAVDDEPISILRKNYTRQPKSIEISYLHDAISKTLTRELIKENGYDNVRAEHPAGYEANRIDIVVNTQEGLVFYEIKTYNSIKTSVREAVGQLLEYCYYPEHNKAIELIIVTHLPITPTIIQYFKHLRNTLLIPIYYQYYDLEKKKRSRKY
ncbi:MAG: hypothetical protein AB8G22_03160 [Saprospiraceae bacterium]